MKSSIKKIYVTLILIAVLTSFGTFSVAAYSATSTAQDITLAFIENVLPVDISQYNVTFEKYHETQMPSFLSGGVASELVTYTLESKESVLDVSCMIINNVITYCRVETKKGSVISDRPYAKLSDAAEGFLEKYQTYTGDNLEEMKKSLINVNSTKNMSVTSGNIKLTTRNVKASNLANQTSFSWGLVDQTSFSWVYTVNGADYTKLEITFSNGAFFSMSDNRGLYTIGNTDVNISEEQAINIAMNHIENYSYTMPGEFEISGFNVTEDRTVAELTTSPREFTLYPFWTVMLYLNQTYPGSVYGLLVGIWADSGEVSFCTNQAAGGLLPNADLKTESTKIEENPNQPTIAYMSVATTATIIAIAIVTVVIKKRRK